MRLIDADALINDILTSYGCDPKYIADETIDGLKPYTDQLILERIGLQPTVEAAPRWVMCEDRLPDTTDDVLVYRGKDHVITEDCCIDGHWMLTGVTHWMPIEPPKEDA